MREKQNFIYIQILKTYLNEKLPRLKSKVYVEIGGREVTFMLNSHPTKTNNKVHLIADYGVHTDFYSLDKVYTKSSERTWQLFLDSGIKEDMMCGHYFTTKVEWEEVVVEWEEYYCKRTRQNKFKPKKKGWNCHTVIDKKWEEYSIGDIEFENKEELLKHLEDTIKN